MLTDEQHEIRATGIGSSEIAAIAGIDPFKTAMSVWMRRRGLVEPLSTEATELGDALEEPIAMLAMKRLAVMSWRKGTTVRHPSEPVVATPDYEPLWSWPEGEERRVLEVKNVNADMARIYWDGGDTLPVFVETQVQLQLGVCGYERGHVAALLGGTGPHLFAVAFDKEYYADLLDIVRRWWRKHIVEGVEPAPDGSKAFADYLRQKHPRGNGQVLDADDDAREVMAELKAYTTERDRLEREIAVRKQALALKIGDARGIQCWLGKVIMIEQPEKVIREHTQKASRSLRAMWKEKA